MLNYPRHIVAVAGLITNEQGEVLLIRSPRRGWEFPGGQVEEGETLTQALQREVLEETDVTISVGALVGVYSNVTQPTKVMFGFLGRWVSGELSTSPESVRTEWVPASEVLQRITHPTIYGRMKDMLEFSGEIVYRAYTTNPYQIEEERFL